MSAYRTRVVFISALVFFSLGLFNAGVYGETEGIEGRTLTLKECISIGLKQNPSAEISLQNLKAVQEKIGEAWGGYYPSVKLSSSYTFTEQQTLGSDAYDTRFFLRQTLFDAGATSDLVRSIKHNITAQDYEVKKTESDIVLSVRSAFYDVLKKRDLLEVSRSALTTAEKHLEQSKELYKGGLAARSDVIKSEVQVSNARLDVIKAENALLSAKANLSAAMGQTVTTDFDISAEKDQGQLPVLPSMKDTIVLAYNQRPELQGNRSKIASAEASVAQVKSGLYPNISLDGSYGWQENSYFPEDKKWSVGLTVSIPIFEQFVTRAKIGQAAANVDLLKATERQTLRNIELEVEQAWLSLKEAIERLAVTKKALEQSDEDMRVSEGRYKEGIGNILEVIDAQTALTQARTNNVVALYDIASAGAKLDRAAGKKTAEERDK